MSLDKDITDEQHEWIKVNCNHLAKRTGQKAADTEPYAAMVVKLDTGAPFSETETDLLFGLIRKLHVDTIGCISYYRIQTDREKFDPYQTKAETNLYMIEDLIRRLKL